MLLRRYDVYDCAFLYCQFTLLLGLYCSRYGMAARDYDIGRPIHFALLLFSIHTPLRSDDMANCLYCHQCFQLNRVLLQRRPIKLNEEEKWLHKTTFSLLNPRRMRRLLGRTETRETPPGGVLIKQGEELRALIIVLSGSASVMVDGVKRATLYPGDFAGEMSFITGRLTSADVIADEPVRYMIWSATALERLYQRDADMKNAVHSIIGFDMASKLAR